ncbi:MAG: DUF3644 domain-containing protein [Candidatus Palauibacterales bacterium]|nr:DUF3644 domain-containing protein [Candidatus Palauibacterales bacterium]
MVSRSTRLLDKAEAALVSAIEVYNKPDFQYREETFAILTLNAWELILKAKMLADNDNNPRALYVYESRRLKSGEWSRKQYIKRNRAGNPHTMGLSQVINTLGTNDATRLSHTIRRNINALTEIRDNAVHFLNAGPRLSKQVLEIGTASVKNYIELSRQWFDRDLSSYNLYLMPIGFVSAPGLATAVSASADEEKLIAYLNTLLVEEPDDAAKGFHVALEVNLSFKRSAADAAARVALTDDPNAPHVTLTEEDIRKAYPWDYEALTDRLRARYVDFKCNGKYHRIRERLKTDDRYCRARYLDPGNPRSAKKDFYNPNIVAEFDRQYAVVE